MRTFIEFLQRYNYFLLFVLLEVVSFVLLFRFNSYQGSVWLTAAGKLTAEANGLYAEGEAFINLRDVNKDLTSRNILLQQQNDRLRESIAKMRGADASGFADSLMRETLRELKMIPALVVSNSTQRQNNYVVLNRGLADGVQPEQGVVNGQGVVGIVYLCEQHHALVIPLTNHKSNLSCRVRGENYFGSLTWEGNDYRYATLDDIPRYAKVKKGDVVETSGYSAVFPPGFFVGRVTEVLNSPDGQSYTLRVHLGTDFAKLRDVAVVQTPYKAEIDSLQKHVEALDNGL